MILETLIWAIVVLALGGSVIWLANKLYQNELELRRSRLADDANERRVALMERETAAALAESTIRERAEHEKSRLQLEASENRAAALVAESPEVIAAKVAEQQRIIEARAEGNAIAAKERAMREPGTTALDSLMSGYEYYRNTGGTGTFDYWFGETDLSSLTLR
jgi:hypothetical protein